MANSNSALKISQGYGFKPGFGHFWAPGSNPSFWVPGAAVGPMGPMGQDFVSPPGGDGLLLFDHPLVVYLIFVLFS